jgi:F-type H+-transporting ATPase subunit b
LFLFTADPANPGAGQRAFGVEAFAAAAEAHPPEAATERPEVGEGGAHEGPEQTPLIDLKKLALQLLNFAVLLFILVKFGGGAINKALAARHHQLKADLASAAELRAIAEAKLGKQEARLASLQAEIADMRRGIKAEADAEKARLIAAAEARAERIKSETTFLVEQQVREAEARLRRESADTALKVAEEILRRAIGAGDQQRLLDTFVSDIEKAAAATASTAGRIV